jgi:ubiquinone/menaquinone biosynthesis C-methylase UbiE
MKWLTGKRVPLEESSFKDAAFARFYDEHARRFMGIVYRRFTGRIYRIGFTGIRVLDAGAGTGLLSLTLAKERPDLQLTGIDISEDMLQIARETAARNGLTGSGEFLQAAAEALPFADGSFDLIISNASLHLWKDPVKVFREIVRVTAPGGGCLIWDNLRLSRINPLPDITGRLMGMNREQLKLWKAAMCSGYTVKEARELARAAGFKDVRTRAITRLSMLEIMWRKPSS